MQLHCYQTISLFRLKACDVAYIGLREVDPEETQIIQDLDMQAFSMRDVDELGIREVLIMQFIQTRLVWANLKKMQAESLVQSK